MTYRLLNSSLLLALGIVACGSIPNQQVPVATIHEQAIVIDTHSDFLDRSEIDGSNLNDDVPGAQTTITKLQQGHVDAQFFAVFVPPSYNEYGFTRRTDELIDRFMAEIDANLQDIEFVSDSSGIQRLANTKKIAALIGIEGGHSIENDLANLRHFYDRGVRYMTLTWANSNDWATSSSDESHSSGLSPFGIEVINEMNQLGMMIDVSHVSDKTFWDVISNTRSPIIASHSSARSVMNHPRNMSDEMIVAVADNGGVIQVNFYSAYIDEDFNRARTLALKKASNQFEALEQQYADDPIELDRKMWTLEKKIEQQLSPPSSSRVVDHIDHIVKLTGANFVGLGTDYDGMGAPPKGLEHIGKIANITAELSQRKYSSDDIRKILGGNLMRVFMQNESISDELLR